jgi:hypothetical protein
MDFAGSWYPAGPDACARAIESYHQPTPPPRARLAIAPHAGWTYSGRLAALAYQSLAAGGDADLVIVLGGHLRKSDPLIVMAEGAWETPFGPFALHAAARSAFTGFSRMQWETPSGYEPDNSTELQLPFAKHAFPKAELLALRVPPSTEAVEVGAALADYLARSELRAVAIASTDLTHYGPNYRFETQGRGEPALRWVREENDPAFIHAVQSGSPQTVLDVSHARHCACSAGGVIALTEMARRQGLRFEPLGYCTSADVKPPDTHNFVGYLAGIWR